MCESSSDEASTSTNNKKPHVCPYKNCSAAFVRPSKLVYHIRRHTGERPFACDFPNCNKTYLYSFHLRRHKESHGKIHRERIKCPVPDCYLELANKYSLKKHIKCKHASEYYPLSCDFCKQGFHKKKQLLNHIHVHTGVPSWQCVTCDTFFFTTTDLNRHKRTHQKYECKCGATFERWTILLAHKRTCDTAKHVCNICNVSFKQLSNFKTHIKTHFKTNAQKFVCGYTDCKRSYMHKKNLTHHIQIFHQKIVKKIPCTVAGCTKTFKRSQNLKQHVQKVHNKKSSVKTQRRPRKDKGISKKSTAAILAGLELPQNLHSDIIKGAKIDLPTIQNLPNLNQVDKLLGKSSETQIDEHQKQAVLQCWLA